jgi:ATP adenylyltransferase
MQQIGINRTVSENSHKPRAKQWSCGPSAYPRENLYTDADGTPPMDQLFTPWRYAYITLADSAARPGVPASLAAWPGDHHCVFCNLIACIDFAIAQGMDAEEAEAAGGLVYRGKHCFVCLNAYPYTSGHVMVMPYAHLDRLAQLPTAATHELMDLAQRTEQVLEGLYHPQGFNFGLNLGRAGGAGVAGHLHMHAMPRWLGDTNFMTTIAETRILPEDLQTTWKRMRAAFGETGCI